MEIIFFKNIVNIQHFFTYIVELRNFWLHTCSRERMCNPNSSLALQATCVSTYLFSNVSIHFAILTTRLLTEIHNKYSVFFPPCILEHIWLQIPKVVFFITAGHLTWNRWFKWSLLAFWCNLTANNLPLLPGREFNFGGLGCMWSTQRFGEPLGCKESWDGKCHYSEKRNAIFTTTMRSRLLSW